MKTLKYLSPSSISKYVDNPSGFYLQYLADNRPEREPQTEAMAVGSAFDAYCKSYLHNALYGDKKPEFALETIFEKQVEPHNRTKAREDGIYVFDQYKKAGCLADIMIELKSCIGEPRFEFEVEGMVAGKSEIAKSVGPIPFLGKPDICYTHKEGARIVTDWKVNGFYSKSGKSPMQGYVRLRDINGGYGSYKGILATRWKGVRINHSHKLDMLDQSWARQISIYAWLLGEEVGSQEFVAGIDQVVCRPNPTKPKPNIRFAEHRLKIGAEFQHKLFDLATEIWTNSNDGWFFKDLNKIQSQLKCESLDKVGETSDKPIADNDDWFRRMEAR